MKKGLESHKTASIFGGVFLFIMICFDAYKYFTTGKYPDLFAIVLYVALILMIVFSIVSAIREKNKQNEDKDISNKK